MPWLAMTTTVQWMSRYIKLGLWELTVMLGRPAAIGLSYYHQGALCWNNEILHKNMFSWPFFHSIFIYDFICKMLCKNDKLKWYCAVLIWFASYWAPNHMSNYSETCKLHWNQIRVWSESADVIISLFHISNGSAHILTDHTPVWQVVHWTVNQSIRPRNQNMCFTGKARWLIY